MDVQNQQSWNTVITHQIPKKPKDLLKWPLRDGFYSVEDELANPKNPQVFLSASLAFLQKQFLSKINSEYETKTSSASNETKRYSDLLIFDFNTERYFVRVKNVEKNYEMLQNEAKTPSRTLSLAQLIPSAKKPRKNNFLDLLISKTASTLTIIQNPSLKASLSLFSIFKRPDKNIGGASVPYVEEDKGVFSIAGTEIVDQGRLIQQTKPGLEKRLVCASTSTCTLNSGLICIKPSETSLEVLKANQSSNINRSLGRHSLTSSTSSLTSQLSKEEIEILRIIPSHPIIPKKSNERHKTQNAETVRKHSRIGRSYFGPEISEYSGSSGVSAVRKPSSKLSVCLEDEEDTDWETEELLSGSSRSDVSGYSSCNLTDEVKSNFSPEALDVIMRRLMQNLEYNPNKFRKFRKRRVM